MVTKVPNVSGLYVIRNKLNDRLYIGSAKNLYARRAVHFCELRKGMHHNHRLQHSWNKHGPDSFTFEVLALVPEPALRDEEQRLLDTLTPCYNLSTSAFRPARTPEGQARLTKIIKARARSAKGRARMSARSLEFWRDDEHKRRMTKLSVQRWADPDYKETLRKKLREGRRRHHATLYYDGRMWSPIELAEHYGLDYSAFRARLKLGWDVHRAVTQPFRKHVKSENTKRCGSVQSITCNGKTMTVPQWSEETGIHVATIRYRLSSGLTPEQALSVEIFGKYKGKKNRD